MKAGYVRLSRDEDKENYTSITSQRDIIMGYAENRGWIISSMYIDDNYSGYNFNRPGFSEMMDEVEAGNIDTIIAKDLSRIGRNNGRMLVLIDRLREMGIRLILVEEGSEGLDLLEDEQDILGIKTWYNEMYIKDISRKVKASMHAKQKSGELIMGHYYGYKKVKTDGRFQLIIDEEIRPAIELIFKEYIGGLGYKKICDILNEYAYPTPGEYLKRIHEERGRISKNLSAQGWQTYMVARILKNDVYIGTLRTGKRQTRFIKGKQEKVPENRQYVFPYNHKAIIDEYTFRTAQKINSRRNEKAYRAGRAKHNYVFAGLIECGDCGCSAGGLNLKKAPGITQGYNCTAYMKRGNKGCSNHAVKEEKVTLFFKEFLKDAKKEYEDYINSINRKDKRDNEEALLKKYLKDLRTAKEALKQLLSERLKELIKEEGQEYRKMIEDAFNELELEHKREILRLNQRISELKVRIDDRQKKILSNIEVFDKIIDSEIPERKYIEMVLDKILIYKDRSLEFRLNVNIDKLIRQSSTNIDDKLTI